MTSNSPSCNRKSVSQRTDFSLWTTLSSSRWDSFTIAIRDCIKLKTWKLWIWFQIYSSVVTFIIIVTQLRWATTDLQGRIVLKNWAIVRVVYCRDVLFSVFLRWPYSMKIFSFSLAFNYSYSNLVGQHFLFLPSIYALWFYITMKLYVCFITHKKLVFIMTYFNFIAVIMLNMFHGIHLQQIDFAESHRFSNISNIIFVQVKIKRSWEILDLFLKRFALMNYFLQFYILYYSSILQFPFTGHNFLSRIPKVKVPKCLSRIEPSQRESEFYTNNPTPSDKYRPPLTNPWRNSIFIQTRVSWISKNSM